MEHNRNNKPKKPGDDKKPKFNIWTTLLITVAVILLISSVINMVNNSLYKQTTYSDFLKEVDAKNLAEVELRSDRIVYMTHTEKAKPEKQQKTFYTGLPSGGNTMELAAMLDDMDVIQPGF